MHNPLPTFPPLLTGYKLAAGVALEDWTKAKAASGRLGAGDLVWSDDPYTLNFALVLEPETDRERCQQILFAAMTATVDSIGALAPPEVAVNFRWPSVILVNDAKAGYADLEVSDAEENGVPKWMVLSLTLAVKPRRRHSEPGRDISVTTLWDEGCGDLNRTMMLESISRHLVSHIHNWSEDGFGPIHAQWWGRISERTPLAEGALPLSARGDLIGLDEFGNALIKSGGETKAYGVMEALGRLRAVRIGGS